MRGWGFCAKVVSLVGGGNTSVPKCNFGHYSFMYSVHSSFFLYTSCVWVIFQRIDPIFSVINI